MERNELVHIFVAILVFFAVASLEFILKGNGERVVQTFVFAFVVVSVPVLVKKIIAYWLDASVRHEIWHVYHYGFKPKQHFRREMQFGVIVPLFFVVLGAFAQVKLTVLTLLTYDTSALKHRAAKRFGYYSYTEMTDLHNGLIGAAGIVSLLLISLIAYFPGLEYLSKLAAYYAFWNMLPISKLDGTQIFFGNRVLWVVVMTITLIFALYGVLLG